MKTVLASGNKHKLEEIQAILKDFEYELITMADAGLVDFEIEENGLTFEENSLIKAQAVYDELGEITIADDSGLEVDHLNGRPGVYSARYSGENASYKTNNIKLLEELSGTNKEQRGAKFVTVITMLFPNGDKLVARGEIKGTILDSLEGTDGFGYDPLFYVESEGMTFAQMGSEQKNKISHRSNALVALGKLLKEYQSEKN